jgi:cytochrome P450
MPSNTETSRISPSSATKVFPPGPKTSLLTAITYRPGRDPLAFFSNLTQQYGDIAYLRMGGEHLFVANDPAVIRDVLVTHNQNFHKSRGLERIKILLGEGLLTSEDAFHLRQRRLIQPAFHRDRIAAYASTMVAYAERVRRAWTPGTTLDVAREMSRLTLLIVGKTLFDADVESQARDVGEAMSGMMDSFWTLMLPFGQTLQRLPIPQMRRGRKARERLDAILYGIIRERRANLGDRGDLLSMLLMAQDDEDRGRGMTDRQVRDEAMTIFLAGHETTANALTWTWYLLSQSPEVERRLHEEIDHVLEGRLPYGCGRRSTPLHNPGHHRIDASLPTGVAHRPSSRQRVQHRPLPCPRAFDHRHEPVDCAPRFAPLCGSRAVRPRPMDASIQGCPAPVCLLPLRRWTPSMHW